MARAGEQSESAQAESEGAQAEIVAAAAGARVFDPGRLPAVRDL